MRGYYTQMLLEMAARLGSPPLARVLPAKGIVCELPPRITPACAGTTHNLETNINIFWDHPRLRGYYHTTPCRRKYMQGSPPLARVLRGGKFLLLAHNRITPAHAGTTSLSLYPIIECKDHPRSRGYYICFLFITFPLSGSPPLTRVLLKRTATLNKEYGITPAHAGTTARGLKGCSL